MVLIRFFYRGNNLPKLFREKVLFSKIQFVTYIIHQFFSKKKSKNSNLTKKRFLASSLHPIIRTIHFIENYDTNNSFTIPFIMLITLRSRTNSLKVPGIKSNQLRTIFFKWHSTTKKIHGLITLLLSLCFFVQ